MEVSLGVGEYKHNEITQHNKIYETLSEMQRASIAQSCGKQPEGNPDESDA